MTLAELNAKDRSGFVSAIGGAFEGSLWVAERAWEKRPFATLEALSDAMASVVAAAPQEEQLLLLCAHPDLGDVRPGAVQLEPDTTRVRLQSDQMSSESQREQAGAGLESLTREELARLRALNSAYREKFGFPFVYAVKGSTKQEILNAIERRLTSMRDVEHREALRQVFRIARFRLEDMVR